MIYDKLPVVLLSTAASEKNSSTNRLIASWILSHHEEAKDMSITELAGACYVGTGSVSRFVRDIGLSGYSELRTLLRETDFSFSHAFLFDEGSKRRNGLAEYTAEAVRRVSASIDPLQLEKLCSDIHEYENVYLFGLLKGQSAAVSLQTDLLLMGKNVHTSTAFSDQMDTVLNAGKEDLIVVFSYTGSYFSAKAFRAAEKHLLLPKIWMVCGNTEEIPWFVNETLCFESDGKREAHPFQLEMAASLITQEYAFRYGQSGQ